LSRVYSGLLKNSDEKDKTVLAQSKRQWLQAFRQDRLSEFTRTYLSSELPQMMIYVEIGMPHALGPRHLPKHPVSSELVLKTTEALK